jgi:hypothetical protein
MIDQETFQKRATELKLAVKSNLWAKTKNLDLNFQSLMKEHCILSGGCFASLINFEPVNDYDLWCRDSNGSAMIEEYLKEYKGKDSFGAEIGAKDVNPKYNDNFVDGKIVTANATTLKNKLQFITNVTFEDAKKSFDFLHCTVSYDFKKDKLFISTKQMQSILEKQLVINNPLTVKEYRRNKFIERGWKE